MNRELRIFINNHPPFKFVEIFFAWQNESLIFEASLPIYISRKTNNPGKLLSFKRFRGCF